MANINKVIPGLGFHHAALKVKDFEKAVAFYRDGLGMTPVVGWGEGDNRAQMLDLGDGGILEIFAGGSDELQAKGKYQHIALTTASVDQAYEAALKAGAKPLTPPKQVDIDANPAPISLYIAFVIGPDGEEVEFFTRLK
jgi:glyoxylase I family protein